MKQNTLRIRVKCKETATKNARNKDVEYVFFDFIKTMRNLKDNGEEYENQKESQSQSPPKKNNIEGKKLNDKFE